MEFYTASAEKRPTRLPEALRQWAWESEHGKYGDEAIKYAAVTMDDIPGYASLSPIKRQDLAIRRIAERAPLRFCPMEKVSGAATLGAAIGHRIPASFEGECDLASVSHHTPNFRRTLTEGMDSYSRQLRERLADDSLTGDQRELLSSLDNVVESMRLWHARYLAAAREAGVETAALLKRVPFAPARTFREAVQSLWFTFAFMRLCGNWPGIGRIDEMLGGYLERDLAEGRLTLDEAREVLASLFVKGCEWIESNTPTGSGDAQHYQNIVLGGVNADGVEVTNEVTYLVLDIVEELAISDFPITVRVSRRTPARLMEKIARVVRHGGGIVAVYNEDLILKSLAAAGYGEREARTFANDGCWEVQIPGKTCFAYLPFDALQIFDATLGVRGEATRPDYANIEELYEAFRADLEAYVRGRCARSVAANYERSGERWRQKDGKGCSVVSLFTDGCIENAASYFDFGPVYTVRSPHIGGAPDVGNSLYAIQKTVFEERRMTLAELREALRANWAGRELDRLYARNRCVYYGNDNDEADAYTSRILNDFADIVASCTSEVPVMLVPGVSTFGRQIKWAPERAATAFGARAGELLSGNDSPTPGTDFSGATAIIRSYCKADLARQTTGAALDVKLYPGTVAGENGLAAIRSLIEGFIELGGYFMQIDVVDAAVLRAAQEHPEDYKTLSVRVSGWNARFVTLDKQWQDMIIERTAQNA